MSVVICSFADCGNRTELRGAHRCEMCSRVRCSACRRCPHEFMRQARPASAGFVGKVDGTPRVRKRSGRGAKPSTALAAPISRDDRQLLRRLANAVEASEATAARAAMMAKRRTEHAMRAEIGARKERRKAGESSTAEHQTRMAGIRSKASRLPTTPGRAQSLLGAGKVQPCIHGMDPANCALCNRGRYLPPIKLRRR